jgi:hypothetical protein
MVNKYLYLESPTQIDTKPLKNIGNYPKSTLDLNPHQAPTMVHSRTLESTWQWYKLLDFRFHMLFLVLVLVLVFAYSSHSTTSTISSLSMIG